MVSGRAGGRRLVDEGDRGWWVVGLAQRSVQSSAYNVGASLAQTAIQFVRSVLLAQLLAPEIFGLYAYAAAFVLISRSLPAFGLGGALLYRVQQSEGEAALRVHFTLSLLFSLAWFTLIAGLGALFMPPDTWPVLVAIALTEVIDRLTSTATALLTRRVAFKRVALLSLLTTILATAVALWMAWRGYGVWSLVATDLVAAATAVMGYYVIRPVWRPRLGWSREVARYFLEFGRRTFTAHLLLEALDRVDDLWTGAFLGQAALGFYSRAYQFATYPRRILATPLNSVAVGTYAELKGQRKRLSQAFFRVNAFLVRAAFLFGGILALVAPEFIRLLLGEKWLPMLAAFRLMLVFTLLDPLRVTVANLFVALGRPEQMVRARLVQLVILVIGLFTLGPMWGIEGVAVAVNVMLVVGIGLLFWQAREHVDFSPVRLFTAPALGLIAGVVAAQVALSVPALRSTGWHSGAAKIAAYSLGYLGTLLLVERHHIRLFLGMIRGMWRKSDNLKSPLC